MMILDRASISAYEKKPLTTGLLCTKQGYRIIIFLYWLDS